MFKLFKNKYKTFEKLRRYITMIFTFGFSEVDLDDEDYTWYFCECDFKECQYCTCLETSEL